MEDVNHPTKPEESNSPKPVDPSSAIASGDVEIGGIRAGDILGGALIAGEHGVITVTGVRVSDNADPTTEPDTATRAIDLAKNIGELARKISAGVTEIGKAIEVRDRDREMLSSAQALGRIAAAVKSNLNELQLNMEKARRESSQFFRLTMIFSAISFVIIVGGVGLMLAGLVTIGMVTTAASIIPEAGAILLFNKDKELRKTLETYHRHILDAQRVLMMIDVAETIEETAAKDSMKEQIIFSVLDVNPSKRPEKDGGARRDRAPPQ